MLKILVLRISVWSLTAPGIERDFKIPHSDEMRGIVFADCFVGRILYDPSMPLTYYLRVLLQVFLGIKVENVPKQLSPKLRLPLMQAKPKTGDACRESKDYMNLYCTKLLTTIHPLNLSYDKD